MIARTKVVEVISKTYADSLDSVAFHAGSDWKYTRRQMVDEIGCGSFNATTRLSKVLRRLGISTPAQLYKLDPVSLARTRGIGEASIFVAMCILEVNKYDVVKWWNCDVKFRAVKIRKAQKYKQEVA